MSSEIKSKYKILHVAAEVIPYASVGGISMVVRYLSKAMVKEGHDVRVFMPRYALIDETKYKLELIAKGIKVPTGHKNHKAPHPAYLRCNIKATTSEDGYKVYFLENMEYYEKRYNVYNYSDDNIRWALLCYGALTFLSKHSDWVPDIIHVHDWHSGLLPNILKANYADYEVLSNTASVLTIHSIAHQGQSINSSSDLKFDDGKSRIPGFFSERLKELNYLKRGIMYSDAITTVSEGYAKEILTENYGVGLNKLLSELRSKLFGIVNGIDYEKMNPATDPNLESNYDLNSIEKRSANKLKLQREFNLEENLKIPLFANVGRLDHQKGIDLLVEVLNKFLRDFNAQFVIIGGGDANLEKALEHLYQKYPKKVGIHTYPNFVLPRLVFGGADFMLMPSRFEPCGIVQLESMRYGCIPIARDTGGLKDTIKDFNPENMTGNGFKFKAFDGWSLYGQMVRAMETYRSKDVWKVIVRNAMSADFSWEKVSQRYIDIYAKALKMKSGELVY